MSYKEVTRRREALDGEDGSGPAVEADGHAPRQPRCDDFTRHARMIDQQRCRDYWRAVYGPEAERLSRGGVTWLP